MICFLPRPFYGQGRRSVGDLRSGPVLALGVAVMLLAACRQSNPAFEPTLGKAHVDSGGPASASGESSALSTIPERESSTPSTSQDLPTGHDASKSTPASSESPSSSSASSSTLDSSSTTDPAFDLQDYCGHGSKLCYLLDPDETRPEGQITDSSPQKFHLSSGPNSGITGGLGKNSPPFRATMFMTEQGPGILSDTNYRVESEEFGVDLWTDFDPATARDRTIFELDGVFAIYRAADGDIECVYSDNGKEGRASVDFGDLAKFTHIQCSLQGGKIELRVNQGSPRDADYSRSIRDSNAQIKIGTPGSLSPSGKMKGRIALLRIWEDVGKMKRATAREVPHFCALYDLC